MRGEIGVRDDGAIMVTIIIMVFRCACSVFSSVPIQYGGERE
jgi:hypothetical protein